MVGRRSGSTRLTRTRPPPRAEASMASMTRRSASPSSPEGAETARELRQALARKPQDRARLLVDLAKAAIAGARRREGDHLRRLVPEEVARGVDATRAARRPRLPP